MSKHFMNPPKPEDTELDELIEDVIAQVEEDEPKESVMGTVNCLSLNVRQEPSKTATIICELPAKADVLIDDFGSTDEFYKIYTASGIEGFCMRQFITLSK